MNTKTTKTEHELNGFKTFYFKFKRNEINKTEHGN